MKYPIYDYIMKHSSKLILHISLPDSVYQLNYPTAISARSFLCTEHECKYSSMGGTWIMPIQIIYMYIYSRTKTLKMFVSVHEPAMNSLSRHKC